jgi:hypothetical protein
MYNDHQHRKDMTMKKIGILAIILLSATACTPEEIALWRAFHEANEPAAAVRHTGLTITAESQRFVAEATCAGALTLTNRSGMAFTYAAVYGPTQTPLVAMQADTLDYPSLEPGSMTTIDITAALRTIENYPIHIFLDRGLAFDVSGSC